MEVDRVRVSISPREDQALPEEDVVRFSRGALAPARHGIASAILFFNAGDAPSAAVALREEAPAGALKVLRDRLRSRIQ